MRRLLAIGFIWLCCAAAWGILGATLLVRSQGSTSGMDHQVRQLWGPPLVQAPPSASWTEVRREKRPERRVDESNNTVVTVMTEADVTTTTPLPLEASDLHAALDLEHRKKGLVWFPTYGVQFDGRYTFHNPDAVAREATVRIPVVQGVTYDGFTVKGADGTPIEVAFEDGEAVFKRVLAPGATLPFTVGYRTRGTARWSYGLEDHGLGPEQGRARHFKLVVDTNFENVDFPAVGLSPSAHQATGGRWQGTWEFEQIVGTKPVAVELPQKLNPGPLAAKITFFAPVSLLFFIFVTGMLLAARRRSIHPVNYFLLACAFFSFHLLFAYLIDHLEVGVSFALASLVSIALVVSYARLFVGWGLAVKQLGVSQLLYLVLFSFSFFWDGFTGLAITIGAIATLFVVMQLTGKLDWTEVLARKPEPAPQPPPL
ncbi:MAG: inner membrane CreD family protein [Anaeromyxobacter sp.]